MLFQPRQASHFLAVERHAWCKTGCQRTAPAGFAENNEWP